MGRSVSFYLAMLLSISDVHSSSAADGPEAANEFFEKEVRPLLVEKCQACHGDVKAKAGLKLNSRAVVIKGGDIGPAIVPGKPDESLLLKAVRYQGDLQMPPGGKLTNKQISILEKWVKIGAPWPGTTVTTATENSFAITEKHRQFWSFLPVKVVTPPAIHNKAWPKSDIDRFILAGLEAKKIGPTPAADKQTLIRRVTFDLIGLPPTPAEIDSFLKDESPEAYSKVVDRLLASPLYGERWGRHWLDVVRYADARDLIQLPKESDFREAWRYRDWVVDSFNRDMPYSDFVRSQVAGDLLPSSIPGRFNKEGIVATGMLAIADFVPGEGDKNQMIADYVNDQVDIVGRAFLGLSIACARCHDHKFDPISTEDYYSLAGIFFSTRIVPGPVAGNTPLIKVPLLSPAELETLKSQTAADLRRRKELERLVPEVADRAYRGYLGGLLNGEIARYLVAAVECRSGEKPQPASVAARLGVHAGLLGEWVKILERVEKRPQVAYPVLLRDIASGKFTGAALEKASAEFQTSLAAAAKSDQAEAAQSPERYALSRAAVLHFRADDSRIVTDMDERVTFWPNSCGISGEALAAIPMQAPVRVATKIGGFIKPVIRFDGGALLKAEQQVTPAGSLFILFRSADKSREGERIVGWEDATSGKHGLGLMTNPGGQLHTILRKDGQSGDLIDSTKATGFESVCITWGPAGTTMRRNGVEISSKAIDGVSSDPKILSLAIGGPGSGNNPRFTGDIAEIRIYDRPLSETERKIVEDEIHATWFEADAPKKPARDPLVDFVTEILSSRGSFWPSSAERDNRLAPQLQKQIKMMRAELEFLKNKRPEVIPEAVAVQEGGPAGTRHEGFKDVQVFIRGDPKRLGKMVPRGFPKVLTTERQGKITDGSGRLQLVDWLTHSDNPLTARVMVNRIWQHHFGEGLVRTPNDFGERGERPTHPELLDYLAKRFVESKWSVKAMHRLILLSAVYQQTSGDNGTLARDPENRLFGRMNRRRLEAEAIRDSMLAISRQLDPARGGPPFTDLNIPRRTLYLLSSRTTANSSDFGALFDRANPSMIVAQRGQSIVAPQALFFLNDPFVSAVAKALAARIRKEAKEDPDSRICHLYMLALGRPPTEPEIKLGKKMLEPISGAPDPLARYCQMILSTNEFIFVD